MTAAPEHRAERDNDALQEQGRAAACPPALIWWAIDFLPLLSLGARAICSHPADNKEAGQ